nr:transposase [Rhizobium leguminosarum]
MRQRSAAFAPASCSFSTPIICSSVNLCFFIRPSLNRPDSNPFWRKFSVAGQYRNNTIEQDHRFIKKLTRPMKGFKSSQSASATPDGIEVAHMIRKRQFSTSGRSAFQQFAALAA